MTIKNILAIYDMATPEEIREGVVEHKQYNLGSEYNSVLRLAQEQYQEGRHDEGLSIVRSWEALPEGAVQWLCQQPELPIEDGEVTLYWPPLNEEGVK
jgi:hypothetical protein